MIGDPGPYIEMDGPHVWVPRTVPYLEARRLVRGVAEYGDRVVYRGKVDALLLGFTFDCPCDEVCERKYDEWGDATRDDDEECYVPAWKFELVE